MDPNLFHVDWERTTDALMMIVILAFIIERALALFFENRIYLKYIDRDGLKEIVAIVVSIWICATWKFDALSMIILTGETTVPGYMITGAVIAGGSKGSIKLFHDLLKVKSGAYESRHELKAERLLDCIERETGVAAKAFSNAQTMGALSKADRYLKDIRLLANRSGSELVAEACNEAEENIAMARATAGKPSDKPSAKKA